MNLRLKKVIHIIKDGGIVIMPTDTIFGMLVSALNKKAVERLYELRQRDTQKPFIVLCSSVDDLKQLHVRLDATTKQVLQKIWPNPVSVILPCALKSMSYLHRGTQTLAIRIPKKKSLRELLAVTGPLMAPSANPSGKSPARSIKKAKAYFGSGVDLYIAGTINDQPSTLIIFEDDRIRVIRQGAWRVPKTIQ